MKKVLIIEEDADARDMMVFMFENNGYEVTKAGKDISIEEIVAAKPNIIIVDNELGDKPGNEICRLLKSNDLTVNFPVILYAANQDIEKMGTNNYANAVVAKPFELDDFVWLVSRLAL